MENKTIMTTEVAKKYPVIELKGRGKLIIPESVQKRIDMLHTEIGNIEWCGFTFYKKIEGNINDPSTYVARIEDIYPMNIGTHAYTKTKNKAEEILKMDERIPLYFSCRTGFLHTHHVLSGGAYFSGTDIQELHDNVDKYGNDSYYLSLIVACDRKYVAKIVKLIDIPKNEAVFTEEGGLEHRLTFDAEQVMIMFDLDVEIEGPQFNWNDPIMETRIAELKAEVAAKKLAEKANAFTKGFGRQLSFDDGWEKTDNGLMVYKGTDKSTDNENPYSKFSNDNLKMNLRRILEVRETPTMEIGQILVELTKLNADDFDLYLESVSTSMVPLTTEMFGEHRMLEGLKKTMGLLKTYSGAKKWEAEVGEILACFEIIIEECDIMEAIELDVPEFTL